MASAPATVLVVDDDPDVRKLIGIVLRQEPRLEVIAEAEDGGSALAAAELHRPQIVILDLGLPDLSGQDVLRQLREHVPDVRIVVFTATSPTELSPMLGSPVVAKGDIQRLVEVVLDVATDSRTVVSMELDITPRSVGLARRFALATCAEWGIDADRADDVAVVVSELVTNAIVHAESRSMLRMRLGPASLRLEVVDHGPGAPDPQHASNDDEHGRGLLIVAAYADAWGISPDGNGKIVWAELPRAGAAHGAA
ncbi:MAG TPA: ATP-binding protein [Mycobacteriales bacterium]|nr:ATP-binding protein [Mycobacteriales bacterium]